MSTVGNLGGNGGSKECVCALGSDLSSITVLHHASRNMVKTWLPDGTIKAYDHAKHFTIDETPGSNMEELSALLTRLEGDPHACIIRGTYVGTEPAGAMTRVGSNFEDRPLHPILIEVDGYESLVEDPMAYPLLVIAEYIRRVLPPVFHGASYHWQLSNSAGHPKHAGKLKVHLWLWLKTPYTSFQLREWAKASELDCDHSVFNPVQIHYTGAPIFEAGVVDPVRVRSGHVTDAVDAVPLVIDAAILEAVQARVRPPKVELVGKTFDDPVATFLIEKGLVLRRTAGRLDVKCPWDSGHSSGTRGDTSSAWLLAGTGNYELGHYKCLHDSCGDRTDADFQRAIGQWDANAMEGFEDLTLAPDGTAIVPGVPEWPTFVRSDSGQIKARLTN